MSRKTNRRGPRPASRPQGLRAATGAMLAGAALLLAACNTTESTPGPGATTSPTGTAARSPAAPPSGPAACAGPIAAFETIIDSDVSVGHLNRSVYQRVRADLAGVRASCAAGQTGQAVAALAAVKSRYGYR